MLCSSRPGLDDVLSCNAATGTAIVTSGKGEGLLMTASRSVVQMFALEVVIVIFIGRLGKINPDQLLTHWPLRRFAPSQQQRNDDAR